MVSWMPARVAVPISPSALDADERDDLGADLLQLGADLIRSHPDPADPGEERAPDHPRGHLLRLGGDQAEHRDPGAKDHEDAEHDDDRRRDPGRQPAGQPSVDRREHHVEDRGADEPGAERPQGIEQREPEGQDEPGGALRLGIQESACEKSMPQRLPPPARTEGARSCPRRNRPRDSALSPSCFGRR